MYLDPSGKFAIAILFIATIIIGGTLNGIAAMSGALKEENLGAAFLGGFITGAITTAGLAIALSTGGFGLDLMIAAGSGVLGGLAGNAVSQQLSYGNIEAAPLIYSSVYNAFTNSIAFVGLNGTGLFDSSFKWNFEEAITPSAYAIGATGFFATLPNINPNSLRSEYRDKEAQEQDSKNILWRLIYG